MDPNTAMEAAAESAKAIAKFQEIIQKIFNPKWTRAQTDADMDANERKLQMIRDNPDMDIVFVGDEMHVRKSTPEELAARARQRMLVDAVRQETNIEKVLEVAAKELPTAEAVSDEPVDADWITRFFDIIKDISNEEMQYVWGKILAGEISMPNSFSLRTLEIIRNLSRQEAEAFQKILPYTLRLNEKMFVISDTDILKKYGIRFGSILVLDECGLISSDSMISLNVEITDTDPEVLFSKNRVAVLKGVSPNQAKLSFGVFSLTRVGKELATALEYESNDNYFDDVAEMVFEQNRDNVVISVHGINQIFETDISYTDQPIKVIRAMESE
ncbi:MAG: DUF2806 domain-containing protein [Oscillospiraceae bacterium]|nr:DUF2806 domain-containing protein [Oscillospiraceae bacterium]